MLEYIVESIPDLTLSKYEVFADSGIEGMIEAQTQFIRQLYRAALLGDVSIHFLFEYDPARQEGEKIKIRLQFHTSIQNQNFLNKLRKLVMASGISDYFSLREASCEGQIAPIYTHMCFMRKKERFLQTVVNDEENHFYVVPNWTIREGARLYNIFKLMSSFDEPCCYRIDLFTKKELEEQIHKSFVRPLTYLRNSSKTFKGVANASLMEVEKKDPNVNEVLKQYEEWLKEVASTPIFLGRICSFSKDGEYGQLLLDAAVSECIESGSVTFLGKEGAFTGLEKMNSIPEKEFACNEAAPVSMQNWPITFTLEEAAAFSRFPVLYDGECIEVPKETSAVFNSKGIVLGEDSNRHKVRVPFEMLPKHMFICGVPGAGKTNTMLHIANNLWNHETMNSNKCLEKAHVPFLVLEPAKREYRELALFDIPELIIFSPSASTNFPLELNPFEFPIGLTLSEHIGKLCQVFEGAFPIPAPAPFILDRAIQGIYENLGWNVREVNTGEKEYPTMSELYSRFAYELEQTNYDGELKGNIRSVLEVRIGSLLRREMKDMFDVRKSTLSPEEWLKYPVVIELEALGEGPANFVTLLLCTLIREMLKVNPLMNKERPVRHVIFIEEAHNLISSESQADKPEDSNPKIAATSFIVKMLAEVRALREGIIIADQLPTAMAPEVIKNTNIKLVHRLTSQDDRGLVGSTMSASPMQLENMASYTKGHALFTYEDLLRPFEMQISQVPEHGEDTPDDRRLYECMTDEKKHPVYVNLQKKRKQAAWEQTKSEIKRFAERCSRLINEVSEVPFERLTRAGVEKQIDFFDDNYKKLTNQKVCLKKAVSDVSDFISTETKEDAMDILEGSIDRYKKVCFDNVSKWLKINS